VMLGAAVSALSLAALTFGPAAAETGETNLLLSRRVRRPTRSNRSKWSAPPADGSGIGFSLVWLTDSENRLWMCDADSQGFVYSYALVNEDCSAGRGPR
jgi:hypothetical protein